MSQELEKYLSEMNSFYDEEMTKVKNNFQGVISSIFNTDHKIKNYIVDINSGGSFTSEDEKLIVMNEIAKRHFEFMQLILSTKNLI